MPFIPCDAADYSDLAALLLAMAAEAGHNIWAINTVTGGFEVPEDIWRQLFGVPVDSKPPPGWDEPLQTPDIEFVDGKYVLTEDAVKSHADQAFMVDLTEAMLAPPVAGWDAGPAAAGREEIRTWARNHGHAPAPQGKLKTSVIEAFRAANPDRATVE